MTSSSDAESGMGGEDKAGSGDTSSPDEEIQVLEFTLGEGRYCLEIEYLEQIADYEELTPVPDAPGHVAGVIDLRGETTTIIDPEPLLDVSRPTDGDDRVLVFDTEGFETEESLGLLVTEANRVSRIPPDQIDTTGYTDETAIQGLIRDPDASGSNGENEYIIWLNPTVFTA